MNILGIGVDVVHIPRIASLIRRRTAGKLATRILSTQEIIRWKLISATQTEAKQVQFLAVRWALKEAAYKALFPLRHPTWKELTYHPLDSVSKRKPYLEYHPTARDDDDRIHLHSSVSHDGEYVFTTVVAEVSQPHP